MNFRTCFGRSKFGVINNYPTHEVARMVYLFFPISTTSCFETILTNRNEFLVAYGVVKSIGSSMSLYLCFCLKTALKGELSTDKTSNVLLFPDFQF